jgi:hypothetical protein
MAAVLAVPLTLATIGATLVTSAVTAGPASAQPAGILPFNVTLVCGQALAIPVPQNDFIQGAVELTNANDPNESSEGEGIQIAMLPIPGPAPVFNTYGQPQPFFYGSPSFLNSTFVANLTNCDGDENGVLQGVVFPSGGQISLGNSKQSESNVGGVTGILSTATGAGALACPESAGAGCVVAGASSVLLGVISAANWLASLDPPDSNYTTISPPVVPNVPAFSGAPPEVNAAINHLQQLAADILAYSVAYSTAINRADGALIADAPTWVAAQEKEASRDGMKLASYFEQLEGALTQLSSTWTAAGLPPLTVTASQSEEYQLNVLENGLPASELTQLEALGMTPAQVQQLEQFIFSAPAGSFTGTIPNDLASPSVLNTIQQEANALRSDIQANLHP